MTTQISIEEKKYDDANLRLCCASSLLTVMCNLTEGNCDKPNETIISTALYGIQMLVDDAQNFLN